MVKRVLIISSTIKILKRNRALCLFLPKMPKYRRYFSKTKHMSFLIKDNKLLGKCNEIWEKVKNSIKKEFDNEPIYNEKYVKAKLKFYNRKITTNFHNNKIPKERSEFICL